MATATRPREPSPRPQAKTLLAAPVQPVRRSYIDYSLPPATSAPPAEPTPEEQLRDHLRFVRGSGVDGRRAKQPLYRPAVLRRTDSSHKTTSTPAGSPPYSPEASLASLTLVDGAMTPDKPRSGGSREFAYKDALVTTCPPVREVRCGSIMIDGKLIGRMMEKVDWTPDSFRSQCSDDRCTRKFNLFERKHHCRCCGEVFCNACSGSRVDLHPPVRRPRVSATTPSTTPSTVNPCKDDASSVRSLSPHAPLAPHGASSPTLLASYTASSNVPPNPAPATPQANATTAGPVLLPCRVCDTCASSLALGIDPLATRARKPLLETCASTYTMSPTPNIPLPVSGKAGSVGSSGPSPVGSLASRNSGGPRRNSAASQGHQGRDRMLSSDPSISRCSADSLTSASTQCSSVATPPPGPAPRKAVIASPAFPRPTTQQKGKGFYHPFPHGAEGCLFSLSPSSLGGVVIPTAPQYGQVWDAAKEMKNEEDADTEVGSLIHGDNEVDENGDFVPGSYSWSTF